MILKFGGFCVPDRLQKEHTMKMSKAEAKERLFNEEKQRVFQQKFEQDVKSFQTSGKQGQTHHLGKGTSLSYHTVTKALICFDNLTDSGMRLYCNAKAETIMSISYIHAFSTLILWSLRTENHVLHLLAVPPRHDPDNSLETVDLDEDEGGLESFLEDVSPLPKDSINASPIPNALSSAEISPEENAKRDGKLPEPTAEISLDESPSSGEAGDLCVSTANSMYFTPDVTLENIPVVAGEGEDNG